jgi:hypothetical protein
MDYKLLDSPFLTATAACGPQKFGHVHAGARKYS